MYLKFHQLIVAHRERHTYSVKPLDTVVYWLDDADASDAFCGKLVLFPIGQYSNCTLSAFKRHCHEEQSGTLVGIDCGY